MNGFHEFIAAAFGFWVGSAVGSFLNVCIWRLPRGESVVHPPSRCPSCRTTILAIDNVPLLGWLRLRGKCRKCQWPIPARYPIVEAVTGILFALIMVAELKSRDPFGGPPLAIVSRLGYQALFAALLVTSSLIEWDARRRNESSKPHQWMDSTLGLLLITTTNCALTIALFLNGDLLGALLSFGLLIVFLGRSSRTRRVYATS